MLMDVKPRAGESGIERLLTIEDVADWIRTTPAAIHTQRYRGAGPRGVRVGKRILFRRADVEDWLDARAEA